MYPKFYNLFRGIDEEKHVQCKLSKLYFITAKSSNAAKSNT